MTIRLTDDEVFAVAGTAGVPWPTVVPTVNGIDRSEIARAVVRGARSLAVRGLVERVESAAPSPQRLAEELRPLAAALAERGPMLAALVADSVPPHALLGTTLLVLRHEGRAVADLVSPNGVHEIAELPLGQARKAAAAQIRAVFDRGISGGPSAAEPALFVTFRGPADGVARVSQGVCELGAFHNTPDGPRFEAAERLTAWLEIDDCVLRALG